MFLFSLYTPLSDENPLSNALQSGNNIDNLFNNIFLWGIAIAVIAAIVSLAYAGFQYMLSDLVSNKKASTDRMQATALGLALALGAWAILNTINPAILKSSLNFDALKVDLRSDQERVRDKVQETKDRIREGVENREREQAENAEWLVNSDLGAFSESSAQEAILKAAQYAADNQLSTCSAPGGGRTACAYAINEIVSKATGSPINDSLSTSVMYQSLQNSNRFSYVGSDTRLAKPGDIIISPKQGNTSGHVGVIENISPDGNHRIISNSSSGASVRRNFTINSWNNAYSNLGVHIFRAN
jgi:hypothetical protein